MGVEIMTAIPSVAACAPNPDYNFDRFDYNNLTDTYNCPQGETLRTNGNNYLKTKENSTYYVKHYKTTKCQHCPVKLLCTKNAKGRLIERSEYQQYVDINKKNIEKNKNLYKLRQQIVEHPYGTIKRQWGYSYIITKRGIERAAADVGLIMTAYNLRRLFNILPRELFKTWLKTLFFVFRLFIARFKEICAPLSPQNIFHPRFINAKKQALKSPLFKTYNVNLPKLMSF